MTAAAVPARVRPGLGRLAAGLTAASAVVHLLLLDASSLGALAMAGMALACLPCAGHLWRSPTASVWGLTAALDAAMLGLHAQMLASASVHGHHGPSVGGLMWLGLGLVGAQLLVAGAAVLRR